MIGVNVWDIAVTGVIGSHHTDPADTYCVDNVQKKPGKDYDGYSYNEETTAVASGA